MPLRRAQAAVFRRASKGSRAFDQPLLELEPGGPGPVPVDRSSDSGAGCATTRSAAARTSPRA